MVPRRSDRELVEQMLNFLSGVKLVATEGELAAALNINSETANKWLELFLLIKENCPDLRNTRVVDMIEEFNLLHAKVDVYDPWVNKEEAREEYGITPIDTPQQGKYDAIVLAVPHKEFIEMGSAQIRAFGKPGHILYDVKYLFPADQTDARL